MTEINRSLAATLKATGPALIADPGRLKIITEILVALITKEHSCQKDFGDDEDLSSLEGTSEYDWLAIDTALDVVIGLSVALGETFGELWKIFQKPIMKYASSSDSVERSTSVGVIAECIKNMRGQVTPSTNILLKLLLHRMSDEDSETKSNAAYAIGVLQEHSENTQEILKSFPVILGKLEPLLRTDEARCKDNAAGCVSRMILKHRANMPTPHILPALIEILPLKEDFEENEPVYQMIVQLCEFHNPKCFPPRSSPIPVRRYILVKANAPNRLTRRPDNHLSNAATPPNHRRSHGSAAGRADQRRNEGEANATCEVRGWEAAAGSGEV